METTIEFHNCTYCSARIPTNIPTCTKCGAPNIPTPLPFFKDMLQRIKSAFKSKHEHVWADRLASLMPLQFLASIYSLIHFLGLAKTTTFIPVNYLFCLLTSVVSLFMVVVYYPDWYKVEPGRRKEYGLFCFLTFLAFWLSVYLVY